MRAATLAALTCLLVTMCALGCGSTRPTAEPDVARSTPTSPTSEEAGEATEDGPAGCSTDSLTLFVEAQGATQVDAPPLAAEEPVIEVVTRERCDPAEDDEACRARVLEAAGAELPGRLEHLRAELQGRPMGVRATFLVDGQRTVQAFPSHEEVAEHVQQTRRAGSQVVVESSVTAYEPDSRTVVVRHRTDRTPSRRRSPHVRFRLPIRESAVETVQAFTDAARREGVSILTLERAQELYVGEVGCR